MTQNANAFPTPRHAKRMIGAVRPIAIRPVLTITPVVVAALAIMFVVIAAVPAVAL